MEWFGKLGDLAGKSGDSIQIVNFIEITVGYEAANSSQTVRKFFTRERQSSFSFISLRVANGFSKSYRTIGPGSSPISGASASG